MIRIFTTLLIIFFITITAPIFSENTSCEQACKKYVTCILSANPNASSEQKETLKKGCINGCNKNKDQALKCYSQHKNSCKPYFMCILKAAKSKK